MKIDTACALCGEPLDDEQRENPHLDDDGDPICDDCYHDTYEFTCCWCQEYGHVDDQHKFLVVFDPEDAFDSDARRRGYGRGLYAIEGGPYWGSDYLSAWLYERHLRRIGPVPAGADGEGYPCGHLCGECQHRLAWPYEVVLPGEPVEWAPGFRGSVSVAHCRTLREARRVARLLNRDRPDHAARRRDRPGKRVYGGFYEPRPVGWRIGQPPARSAP